MSYHSEAHIIQACQRYELKAQQALYQLYVDRLYYVIHRYIPDRYYTENVLQDVFLKIFKSIQRFDTQKGTFGAWTKTIAIREALNFCKKKAIVFQPLEQIEATQAEDQTLKALAQLQAEDILRVIECIPEKYRIIFNLNEIDGYSHQEIAELLEIGVSTSRSYLTRAKKMIQKQLISIHTFQANTHEKGTK